MKNGETPAFLHRGKAPSVLSSLFSTMALPNNIARRITYLAPTEREQVSVAWAMAEHAYATCECHRGKSCLRFVESVLSLLLSHTPDAQTLLVCILQCMRKMEDLQTIQKKFGESVRATIAELIVIESSCGTLSERSVEQLKRMTIAFAKNKRVLVIVLHNCLALLRNRTVLSEREQKLLAREALDAFAPLAARLGIYALKYEIEQYAFTILYPEEAKTMSATIQQLTKKNHAALKKGMRALTNILAAEGIAVVTSFRTKQPYSVLKKMQRKNYTNPVDLHDLFGIRIIVETEEECYRALGIVHREYQPIPHRMKDYIAMPKPNGYRSLHTTVLGMSAKSPTLPVEVQIRTRIMDQEAEEGIAAHWSYKDDPKSKTGMTALWHRKLRSIDQKDGEENHEEDLEDHIFVLTPQGDVVELRKGATPLDFAFRIHTDVGLRYRTGIVNERIVPIDHRLENGDVVKIQTWSTPRASEQWIHLARTKHARQKLRNYFQENVHPEQKIESTHVQKKSKFHSPHPQHTNSILIETGTPLPWRFAKCCQPEKDEIHPPIVGCITREGLLRIHRKNCRMLAQANAERILHVSWQGQENATLRVS